MPQEQSTSVLIIGILALLALIPWAVAFRRAHAFRDWDLTATLVLLVGALANAETAAYVISSGRKERLDPLGHAVIGFPESVHRIGVVSNGLLLVACVAFILYRLLVARARLNGAPLIAFVIVLTLCASDGLHGQPLWTPRQLTLLAVLLAAAVGRPGRSAFLGGAAVAMLFTVLGGVEALIEPASVIRSCRADNACNVLGVHYAGVFTNENIFGLLLIMCVPFVWLGLRGRVRIFLACYLAFLAAATGSVLAGAAAVATVILLAVLRPRLPDEEPGDVVRGTPGRNLLAMAVLLPTAVMGVVVPLRHEYFGDLRLRAAIWDMAKEEWAHSPLLGYGGKAWSAKYPEGQIPAAVSPSLHNQWIDVLYAGGVVAVVLFVALLVYLLFRDGARGVPAAACVLLPVLLGSVTERPWAFDISNSLTFALLAATLMPIGACRSATAKMPERHTAEPAPVAGSRPET
ncbi:O-antigen ligase family protein [Streptomyces sp. NBC_01352]|uniref:O-antigen ligase-related domain-containing protein n=1 Tax=Streptomyces plumbiresistens TaxID=511811 RepID=A0ABP7T3J9_9ACTN|nr:MULTISPECIES: O-antigen ligase family protein [unclassified Streptomyces]MCX4705086.1 O-antigen ligase family protein [Streptomyces sp. NBC_01373]